MKKILLLALSLITHIALVAQCDPDLSPPTFTLPLELTEGIVYPCFDSVPSHDNVTDLVYMTLSDSCMGPDIPPCYCGPTLQSLTDPYELTDTSVTYQYIAYDWQDPALRNWSSYEYITFYFESISCEIDSIPLSISKWQWDDVKVYPNPSNGDFTILSKYDYQILNYMGIIQNEDSLDSGVYLIRIGGRISKTKLVIQK